MRTDRRKYREVAIVETDGGHAIELDGRRVASPAGATLILPHPLALAVAKEWAGQGEHVLPLSMPMMRLAATAQDRVAPRREAAVLGAVEYARSELLCYLGDRPPELCRLQSEIWQPILDWAGRRYDAPLLTGFGLGHIEQPCGSLAIYERVLRSFDDLTLTAVIDLAQMTGSLILALALHEGHIDATQAADAALLEETVQAAQWGEDDEAILRRRNIRAEIAATARFLTLLKHRPIA